MKVILIEDQDLLRSTLVNAINQSPDIKIVGQSDKSGDAALLCRKHAPDVVLMDIFTSDGNSIKAIPKLKKEFPLTKIIMLTGIDDQRLIKAAEAAGADMFLWKNLQLDELLGFIRNAAKPYRVFPAVSTEVQATADFTEMEIRILHQLSLGKTSDEIATELYLSSGTIRIYISRMYTATGMKSRAQLVAYALRYGLITGE